MAGSSDKPRRRFQAHDALCREQGISLRRCIRTKAGGAQVAPVKDAVGEHSAAGYTPGGALCDMGILVMRTACAMDMGVLIMRMACAAGMCANARNLYHNAGRRYYG